jgi:hypothetical protein
MYGYQIDRSQEAYPLNGREIRHIQTYTRLILIAPILNQPDTAIPESAVKTTEVTGATESPRVLLHMPVDVRSVSLVIIAGLGCIFMLRWASAVFIPLMVGILFSYGLSPVVDWLALRRIPRALSAGDWHCVWRWSYSVFTERRCRQID